MLARALERLLEWVIPYSDADEILGDLREGRMDAQDRGLWATGRHLSQLAGLVIYYTVARTGSAVPRIGADAFPAAIGHDIRIAVRTMGRRPGLTAAIAMPLVLGICAATTLFALVYAVMLRPLPFADADRLMRLGERAATAPTDSIASTSPANFLDLEAGTRAFESLAAYQLGAFSLSAGDLPTRVWAMRVTHNFFAVLGVGLAYGSDFAESDDRAGAEPVVVVSDALARQLFAGSAAALGKRIVLDGLPRRIVGVAPRGLALRGEPRLWVPFAWSAEERAGRRGRSIEMIGRLTAGVSPSAGLAELGRLAGGIAEQQQELNDDLTIGGLPFRAWLIGSEAPRRLLLFSGAAGLLLLIAVVNVANLVLARSELRRDEIALRAALGAGRGQLLRMSVIETMGVSLLSAVLALILASFGLAALLRDVGDWLPRTGPVGIDLRVTAFTLSLSSLIGLMLGIASAGHATTGRVQQARRRLRVRRVFVVAQIALSLMLLVGAILLGTSLSKLRRVDLGVAARGATSFDLPLPAGKYDTDTALIFYQRVLREISATPGVMSVAAQNRPLFATGGNAAVELLDGGSVDSDRLTETREVTPGFFRTLGIALEVGRALQPGDRSGEPVAVVNKAFARVFLGERNTLGSRFRIANSEKEYTIVGVVADVRDQGLDKAPLPTAYFAFGNGPWGTWPPLTFVVRAPNPEASMPLIRALVAAIDPDVPLADITPLEDLARLQLGDQRRMAATLFYAFSLLALALAVSGVYAVVSYAVSSARQAIGIRQALGASPNDIRWLVLRQGAIDGLLGVSIGVPSAMGLSGALSGLLFDVQPLDPLALLIAAGLVTAASLGACLPPARSAAVVDPVQTLRAGG